MSLSHSADIHSKVSLDAHGASNTADDRAKAGIAWFKPSELWRRRAAIIAALSIAGILVHLVMRFGLQGSAIAIRMPLLVVLAVGGLPMVYELVRKLLRREFGSDLLGGISIVTSVLWASISRDRSLC